MKCSVKKNNELSMKNFQTSRHAREQTCINEQRTFFPFGAKLINNKIEMNISDDCFVNSPR